jgi:hypothetical protein
MAHFALLHLAHVDTSVRATGIGKRVEVIP